MPDTETDTPAADPLPNEPKQCRICFDGAEAEPELGRLIRPCLCKGSISYVHVDCLKRWRNTSAPGGSSQRFFACPQCKYQYRFSRTKVVGIATNPAVVGALSAILFTGIVMLSSFVTTYLGAAADDFQSTSYSFGYFGSSFYFYSPYEIIRELVRAAFRIVQDETGVSLLDDYTFRSAPSGNSSTSLASPPGLIRRLFRRFLLGLPVVGAGSVVQMLLSMPFVGPVHWLARWRGSRRRENSRDIAALLIVLLLIAGAIRALYKVYQWTEAITKRILLRAENTILEVN